MDHKRTLQINSLARSLGCSMVIDHQKSFTATVYAEAPSEMLTKACLQDGLDEAVADCDFEEN